MNLNSNHHTTPKTFQIPFLSKLFLFIVLVECFIMITISFYLLIVDWYAIDVRLNLLCIIGTCIFLLLFAMDAILTENIFQLRAFLFLSLLLTSRIVYGLITRNIDNSVYTDLYISSVAIASLSQILYFILIWIVPDNVAESFGYYAYKMIGTDPEMQDMFCTYQIMITFMFLDFASAMLWITVSFENLNETDLILSCVAIAFTSFLSIICWYASKTENLNLMKLFWVCSIGFPAYLGFELYGLVYSHTDGSDFSMDIFNIAISGTSSFVIHIIYFCWSWYVASNFGKGLKEIIFNRSITDQIGVVGKTVKNIVGTVLVEPLMNHLTYLEDA